MSITAGTRYVADFFAEIADFLAKDPKKIKILHKGLGKVGLKSFSRGTGKVKGVGKARN